MEFITELWKPILLSGLAVFVLSALAWTVMPHHQKEYARLANEDAVADALRAGNVQPGLYSVPHAADFKALGTPEMVAKMQRGPVAYITVVPPGVTPMGPTMVKSLISNLVVSVFVGYVAYHALPAGTEYLAVFRVVGTVGFMAYALGGMADSIWFGKPWKSWMLHAMDSLVYGLAMGGVFGWLWV
ncbi:MAG: hypothetical protein WD771_05135 [Gemmatimonadaceae bacterium]